MKNKYSLIYTLIIILIFLSFLFLFLKIPKELDKKIISTSFVYSEKPGFELGTGNLDFGGLTKNQEALRDVVISNGYNFPIKVNIRVSGEIKDFLLVEENNFVLLPLESTNVTFYANPGDNLTEYRRYTGEIDIRILKVNTKDL